MPLVYEAFLGGEGLNEIGAQLQWSALSEPGLIFGIEALQGKNESLFGHSALYDPVSGDLIASSASQPSVIVGYAKTAADVGDTQLRAGVSIARGDMRQDRFDEEAYALSGTGHLYGADLAIRHNFGGDRSLTWQSEWLYRTIDGTQFTAGPDVQLEKNQAGYYSQLIYAHNDEWRTGVRYDNIYRNDVLEAGIDQRLPENLDQLSAMVEYTVNDIARYRLQYTHSNALFAEIAPDTYARQTIDSILFSINFTLGKHVHHPF
jgi:hypothetical protein